MPRLNRTFSSLDIIRIFENNLTSEEQDHILCYLCGTHELISDGELNQREETQLIFDLVTIGLSFIPIVGGPIAGLLDAVQLLSNSIDAIEQLTGETSICASSIEGSLPRNMLETLEDLR